MASERDRKIKVLSEVPCPKCEGVVYVYVPWRGKGGEFVCWYCSYVLRSKDVPDSEQSVSVTKKEEKATKSKKTRFIVLSQSPCKCGGLVHLHKEWRDEVVCWDCGAVRGDLYILPRHPCPRCQEIIYINKGEYDLECRLCAVVLGKIILAKSVSCMKCNSNVYIYENSRKKFHCRDCGEVTNRVVDLPGSLCRQCEGSIYVWAPTGKIKGFLCYRCQVSLETEMDKDDNTT